MTTHVFSIYDAKAESYLPPFTTHTYGIAERMFTDMVNTPEHQFNRHPEDYTLFAIGSYDDQTAHMTSTELTPIINGLQAIANGSPEPALPWEAN